ncbi:hypothetical protein ACP275_01G043600 [Erythranthe tilingii]
MVDKSKKRFIGEDDVSSLLQRYSVNTVLALLREVALVDGEKIDWRELVKNTTTGISGAREYQMLWRHLAYGETLANQFENHDAIPMDDDSDLECEVEAFPNVGREASTEATACVKVLIASGYVSRLPSNLTIEGPLTINIPNSRAVPAPSDTSVLAYAHGKNINIPVTVPRQPLPSSGCGEKRPNDGANLPPRRRKKAWSTQEDMKLTAAVQKYGEPNWANIAKADFDNERTPSELSQRWSTLKKKQGGNLKVGTTSSKPSETQLAAAHRAMSLALDRPMGDNLKAPRQLTTGIKPQQQSQKPSGTPPGQQPGSTGPTKPQMLTKWPSTNPSPTPDSMVKAAAVAAGARIATSADASSLIEAARSQKVVHIKTSSGSTPVVKSSTTSIVNQLPSNVHFIRNGLAKAPISNYSAAKPNITRVHSKNPAVSAVRPSPAGPTASSAVELHRTAGKASTSRVETEVPVQRYRGADRVGRTPDNQPAALGNQSEGVGKRETCVSISNPVSQTKDEGKENTNKECPSKGHS